jgi:hypothetical protein
VTPSLSSFLSNISTCTKAVTQKLNSLEEAAEWARGHHPFDVAQFKEI